MYPLHTDVVATTFWVGEIFDPQASDGSQVISTYDSHWLAHYGGCDGIVVNGDDLLDKSSGGSAAADEGDTAENHGEGGESAAECEGGSDDADQQGPPASPSSRPTSAAPRSDGRSGPGSARCAAFPADHRPRPRSHSWAGSRGRLLTVAEPAVEDIVEGADGNRRAVQDVPH